MILAAPLTRVYSGPDSTARKDCPWMKSLESHLNSTPAQNLEVASPLRAALQTATDSVMSDLDNAGIVNQERPKPNMKKQVLSNNLDDPEGVESNLEVKELTRKRKAVVDASSDVDSSPDNKGGPLSRAANTRSEPAGEKIGGGEGNWVKGGKSGR